MYMLPSLSSQASLYLGQSQCRTYVLIGQHAGPYPQILCLGTHWSGWWEEQAAGCDKA